MFNLDCNATFPVCLRDIYDNLVDLFAEKITIYKQHLLYDYTCTMVRSLVYILRTTQIAYVRFRLIAQLIASRKYFRRKKQFD